MVGAAERLMMAVGLVLLALGVVALIGYWVAARLDKRAEERKP